MIQSKSLAEVLIQQISDAIIAQLQANILQWVGWFTTIGVLFVLAFGVALLLLVWVGVWRLFRRLVWPKKPKAPAPQNHSSAVVLVPDGYKRADFKEVPADEPDSPA